MGLNAIYQASTQTTGAGVGLGGVPAIEDTPVTTPASTNAPGPQQYTLSVGLNQLMMPPNTYAFSRVQLLPQTSGASTNAKSFTDSAGTHVALPGWTAGSVTVPAVPGGSIYIVSASVETITAAFS